MKTTWVLTACAAVATCLWVARTQVIADDFKSDHDFMRQADEIDLTEVKLGKIAQDHGSASVVKEFGQRMIRDHSRMNKDLRAIASKENIVLPKRLDPKDQQLVTQLTNLSGPSFDHAYTKDMVPGHREAIAKFEAEAKNGRSPEMRAWAAKWCPTLEEHLRLAQKTLKEIGGV